MITILFIALLLPIGYGSDSMLLPQSYIRNSLRGHSERRQTLDTAGCCMNAYWRFENGQLTDSIGGFDGTGNALTPDTGKIGGGMKFVTNSGSYMVINPNQSGDKISSLYTDGEYSIMMWAKLFDYDSPRPWKMLFGDWGDPTNENAVHFSLKNGVLDLHTNDIVSGEKRAAANTKISLDTWTHVGVVVKDEQATFYVNGNVDGQGPAATQYLATINHKAIGAKGQGYYPFHGILDEVAMFGCALTEQDFKNLYDKSKDGTPYTCDEPLITASVRIRPKKLNQKSRGNFVTCYIQLPTGFSVCDIDRSSIKMNGSVSALIKPWSISDKNDDEVPDLMIKFDREEVQNMLDMGKNDVTVTGELTDGTKFSGMAKVKKI